MKIRIADIIEESFVDGEVIRFTIFVQGCHHHCKGCHNPTTHDFNSGKLIDTADIAAMLKKPSLINGITFSGGEPLCQINAITELAKIAKSLHLNVWCYTGYTYEVLFNESACKTKYFDFNLMNNFLQYVDVLVDGLFIESQRDLTMSFCGSRNQRLIDVQKSLSMKKIVIYQIA